MKRSLEEADIMSEGMEGLTKAPRTHYAFAFKLLASDALAAAILGAGGAGIQEIQSMTESKISLANRSDKYHNTNLRLVLIRGNNHHNIDGAFQAILLKLRGIIENPFKEESQITDFIEMITKHGEYKLKCVVPKQSAGAVIGNKGATVAQLRDMTGCKVRVEEGKIGTGDTQEQIVSLLGSIESLMACLQQINIIVQEQAGAAYFQDWAHLRVKQDAPQPRPNLGPNLGPHLGHQATTVSPHIGAPRVPIMPQVVNTQDDALVQRTLNSVPKSMVNNRTFAVQASLPIECTSGIIGKQGHNTKEIAALTGAKVTLRDADPNTVVTIEGSLNSVLSGYTLVMKKYLELEAFASGKGTVKGKGKGKGK